MARELGFWQGEEWEQEKVVLEDVRGDLWFRMVPLVVPSLVHRSRLQEEEVLPPQSRSLFPGVL